MNPSPAQIRQRILELMESACAATSTGNPFVVNATRVAVDLELVRLIPDKPTLADIELQK